MTDFQTALRTRPARAAAILTGLFLLCAPLGAAAGQGRRGGGGGGGGGGRAVPRGGSGGGATAPAPSGGGSAPAGPVTRGTAVPRGSVPSAPRNGGGRVYVPGYYGGYWPWAFGGLGFGYGYYGGYYDPYYPWYQGYGPYGYAPVAVGDADGSLRLKVQPVNAQVYVDGFYAGVVDDFKGVFERLHLVPGPHHVEVRAPGYETLGVDVMIRPDQTVTLARDLARGQ